MNFNAAQARIATAIASCTDHDLSYGSCDTCGVFQNQHDEIMTIVHSRPGTRALGPT